MAQTSEIVVGIDFGTTHSGVSWAINGGSKKIRLINDWEDPRGKVLQPPKVPSSISYISGKEPKWGYSVSPKDESFKWIKVLLESDSQYQKTVEPVKQSNVLLEKINKTAQNVVTDYLRLLWNHTLQDIRDHCDSYDENIFALKIVLTVPAMWTPAAKEKTIQAARASGMPDDISLVTEPEAAALATLKEKAEEEILKVGDAFVVCDAGGGTVDLISYEVLKLNPLKLRECAIGKGDLCGSVFLDLAFQSYICTLIGKEQYDRIKDKPKREMMEQFEYGIKRCFTEKGQQQFSVELRGVQDDPEHDIIDESIPIKASVLRTIFDHISLQIENLVAGQLAQVREKGLEAKAILLVGGFGESKYLLDRLRNAHRAEGITVTQVVGAWSSICRGATMWGLEHSEHTSTLKQPTVTSRLARYSYGFCLSEIYDPSRHLVQDRVWDTAESRWRAGNQMIWVLKRGEEVEEGRILVHECYESVKVSFWDTGERQFQKLIWYCEDESPPSRKTPSVFPLCAVEYSISVDELWLEKSYRNKEREKFRNCSFGLYIILGNAALDFFVTYKDQPVAYVEAQYRENF